MALYTVLEPPDGKPDRVAFIPEGFAWGAYLFTFLWALWHRLWIVAALAFTVFVGLNIAIGLEILSPVVGSLAQFGLSLLFGLEARRLQESSFMRAGFRRAGLIEASRLEAAELAYFAQRAPAPPPPVQTRFRPATEDTLGIFSNV